MKLGYARVSTGDQSLDLQLDALKNAGCKNIYQETASGVKTDRPQLASILKAARAGDIVVCWRLDRIARSVRQLIDLVENLRDRGIEFISLQENIDTTTPGGELVFHIFAALAQFERSIIVQRTKAGLASARARGRMGGRPKVLSKKDLKAAKIMMESGKYTITEVAEHFGVNRSTLYRNVDS